MSGGDGASDALKHVLQLLFRTNPGRASVLAGELIDRDLLNVPMSLESLIIAGSAAGVRPELLIGAYSELLAVIHTGDTSEAATSVGEYRERFRKLLSRRFGRVGKYREQIEGQQLGFRPEKLCFSRRNYYPPPRR